MTSYLEEWRPVVGFDDYEISDQGRVKSLKFERSLILKPVLDSRGRHLISLYRHGQVHQRPIHRLIALAFLENPENFPMVRHLNDDRSCNLVTNLAWGTNYDNMQDAIKK